jgi:hypothetical protein
MRKAGRPRKAEDRRKSAHLSIRISAKLRDRLEEARVRPDGEVSLSEEVELRLSESFERDKNIEKRFGGPATAGLLEIVADRIRSIEISTGGIDEPEGTSKLRWFDDRFTYDQVRSMIDVVLDHFKPAGRRTIPKAMRWHPSLKREVENLGRHSALLALASFEAAPSKESEVQAMYRKAALQLKRKLKGSPIEELSKDREQTRQRILKHPAKRDAAAEFKAAAINVLASYLQPPRLIEGAKVNIAGILKGITSANLAQEKQQVIKRRIKRAVKDKLAYPASSLDNDLSQILDAVAAPMSDEMRQRILKGSEE